jgi:catechol 1,2-dioxygenase
MGCEFLVSLGKATSEKKNEVILASDILGASTLITLINNDKRSESSGKLRTDSALLGPFWRKNAPTYEAGANISHGPEAQETEHAFFISGHVRDAQGKALADATVDVWHASPLGFYENQDSAQPDMNLRGQFKTDANGYFHLQSILPAGYPVPVDGPCGDLLRNQQRDPFRPAHVHFMVSKPGYQVLTTQVFADNDARLSTDVTFSVLKSLVGTFQKRTGPHQTGYELTYDFVLQAGETQFPTPPIP